MLLMYIGASFMQNVILTGERMAGILTASLCFLQSRPARPTVAVATPTPATLAPLAPGSAQAGKRRTW